MNSEDDEFARIEREQKMRAVPDPIHHTDPAESLEYITGWNDCRQAMLKQPAPVQEHVADALIRQYINALVSNKPDEAANVTKAMVDYVYTTPQPAQQEQHMKTTIEMAQSVGAGEPSSLYGRTDYVVFTKSELEHFAELVRADEREQCAKVADEHMRECEGKSFGVGAAIRAAGRRHSGTGLAHQHRE